MKTSLNILIALPVFLLVSCRDFGEPPIDYHNRILFTSSRSGTQQLYMVYPDGSDLRQLTTGPYDNYNGHWSYDAKHIAFNSTENGSTAGSFIFLMDSDGKNRHSLGVCEYPTDWTRDGSRILFGLYGNIYVVNADGTGYLQLTDQLNNPRIYESSAFFSADASKIYFISNRFDPTQIGFEIYTMNTDGSNIQRLTYSGGTSGAGSLSPDGKSIAFYHGAYGAPGSGVYIMRTDTSGLHLVLENTATETYGAPRWSPDGTRLVVLTAPAGQSSIEYMDIVNIDGTGLRRVIAEPIDDASDWSW